MAHIKKLATKEPWKAAVVIPKQNRPKDWTEVTANVITDVAAGTVGGVGGSFMGGWSIPAGIVLSAVGHSTGQRWLTAMGIGMIASPFDPGKSTAKTSQGAGFSLKDEFEAGKERTKDYVEMLKEKFFINKFFGKKATEQTTETPDSTTVNGLDPGIEKATLDRLTEFDQQILSEGIEFQAKQGASPDSEATSFNGVEIEIDQLPHLI